MRFKNEGKEPVSVPFQRWVHPKHVGGIVLSEVIDPEELSHTELVWDPNDPRVQRFLKDRNLRVVELPDRFQRILADLDGEGGGKLPR